MFLARFPPPQLIFSALIVVSVSSLGFVFYLEVFQGLPPCALCLYQRIPYYSVAGISLLGVLVTGNSKHVHIANMLALLCVLAFLAGSALALFHVGVENTWWQGTTGCGGSGLQATDFEDLKKTIMEAPTANCREILWEYRGISLATWNLLWSIFLTLTTATALRFQLHTGRA